MVCPRHSRRPGVPHPHLGRPTCWPPAGSCADARHPDGGRHRRRPRRHSAGQARRAALAQSFLPRGAGGAVVIDPELAGWLIW